ncbi:hypothetical protein JN853_23780 [Pseudomonas syringae pv. actinidiae ICMP 9853]|nr:hypothetical protein JN853_23780 [Pseudomonas syringae pv. actinidiae ICMP 9853]
MASCANLEELRKRASARRAQEIQEVTTAAKRPHNLLTLLHLANRGGWFCCRFPADRGQVRSYKNRVFQVIRLTIVQRSASASSPKQCGQAKHRTGPLLICAPQFPRCRTHHVQL